MHLDFLGLSLKLLVALFFFLKLFSELDYPEPQMHFCLCHNEATDDYCLCHNEATDNYCLCHN